MTEADRVDARTQPTADEPAAQEHSGLLATALMAAALVAIVVATAVAIALGLSPARAAVVGAVVSLTVSTAAALLLGGWLGLHRRRAVPGPVITLPEPVTLTRLEAAELVEAAESRLLRAVELGAPEAELMGCVLDLQAARLRLARVLLAEDGELPQALKDELLVAHRGTSDWQRSPRVT